VIRLFSTAVLGLAATVLSITPAAAAPPEPVPTEPDFSTDCGFTVQGEHSGKFKPIEHAGYTAYVSPNQRVTLTNIETGETVSYVITGVVRITPTDNGETWRFTGHNAWGGPGIERILFMTGTQTFVVDEEGTFTLTESHGKVVNVCDVLAP